MYYQLPKLNSNVEIRMPSL